MFKVSPFKLRYFAVLFTFSVIMLSFVLSDSSTISNTSQVIVQGIQIDDAQIEVAITGPQQPDNSLKSEDLERNVMHTVKSGDTLYNILNNNGISPQEIDKITRSMKRSKITTTLHLREVVDIYFGSDGDLEKIFIYGNPKGSVEIAPNNDLFIAQLQPLETFKETVIVASSIRGTFYSDALKAGASNNIVKSFINNFSGAINFQRDIHKGDSFEIKYEIEKSEDGKIVAYGPMQYGSITIKGKKYQLYRYADASGSAKYVDENGVAVKRSTFIKPVKETRISSGYGYRKHPVTKKRRMHTGVDYAAPTGTPIVAAAAGKIEFVKTSRTGYGKHIKIKHNGTYSTLYGHMSKFARGIKSGTKVKQGQVIGYVGMTGTATGPHLHYEVRKNGAHMNPLKVTFSEPETKLTDAERKRFLAQKSEIDTKFKIS